jgi:hypothetical protein
MALDAVTAREMIPVPLLPGLPMDINAILNLGWRVVVVR